MPRRTSIRRRHGHRRGRKGGSFWSFLKKANAWLRKHKIISTVGKALGSAGVPYASQIGSVAGKIGYGISPVGGALRRAGAGRRRRRCR